jgi:ATP adenylyltransferase/5',5'''-P-1,P-4-tetraphosphate phosphorylase II
MLMQILLLLRMELVFHSTGKAHAVTFGARASMHMSDTSERQREPIKSAVNSFAIVAMHPMMITNTFHTQSTAINIASLID